MNYFFVKLSHSPARHTYSVKPDSRDLGVSGTEVGSCLTFALDCREGLAGSKPTVLNPNSLLFILGHL